MAPETTTWPGFGKRLQASRNVQGVAQRRERVERARLDVSRHHETGMDADADLDRGPRTVGALGDPA